MEDQGVQLGTKRAAGAEMPVRVDGALLRRGRFVFLAALLVLAALVSYLMLSRPQQQEPPVPAAQTAPQQAQGAAAHAGHSGMHGSAQTRTITLDEVKEEWGVRLTRLTLIADGGLVDVRYEVADPEKASAALGSKQQIYLLDEESGKSVSTAQYPKLGSLRPHDGTSLREGQTYFMGFSNPGGIFERDDRVTLAAGSYRLEHVPIR